MHNHANQVETRFEIDLDWKVMCGFVSINPVDNPGFFGERQSLLINEWNAFSLDLKPAKSYYRMTLYGAS